MPFFVDMALDPGCSIRNISLCQEICHEYPRSVTVLHHRQSNVYICFITSRTIEIKYPFDFLGIWSVLSISKSMQSLVLFIPLTHVRHILVMNLPQPRLSHSEDIVFKKLHRPTQCIWIIATFTPASLMIIHQFGSRSHRVMWPWITSLRYVEDRGTPRKTRLFTLMILSISFFKCLVQYLSARRLLALRFSRTWFDSEKKNLWA